MFFENTHCAGCGSALGYVPEEQRMVAFAPTPEPAPEPDAPWVRAGDAGVPLQPCANRLVHGLCNWMVDTGLDGPLCASCRLNLTVPDPTVPGHLARWAIIESAKRRLMYGARRLGLAPQPKADAGDTQGLGFRILDPGAETTPVVTGHVDGVVTLNLMEADDVHRETVRASFQEPWRTVLGHLRHEFSHYLFHRWIAGDDAALDTWRATFGDERADYAQALQAYHAQGAPAGWQAQHVSAYATAHPHEDWAETCAHLLLILDGLETAHAWGLQLDSPAAQARPQETALDAAAIETLVLQQWLPVAQCLNAMNRSLGLRDSYPFLLPPAVVAKLQVAAALVQQAATARVQQASRLGEPVQA